MNMNYNFLEKKERPPAMHHLRNSLGAGKKTTFKCQNNF